MKRLVSTGNVWVEAIKKDGLHKKYTIKTCYQYRHLTHITCINYKILKENIIVPILITYATIISLKMKVMPICSFSHNLSGGLKNICLNVLIWLLKSYT